MAERPVPVQDLDWEPSKAAAFAEETLGIWMEVLEGIRERRLPVGRRHTAAKVRDALTFDVPDDPMELDDLTRYLRTMALEYSTFLGHPRFMAYITGAGTVPGAAADLLAAGLNMNTGGWQLSPSATEIELHLCRWFAREMFGLPEGSGGELTSGGAMANLVGLKLARDDRAGWDVRHQGIAAGPPLGVYLSTQTHTVSLRAADTLGIGWDRVRQVPVGTDLRIDVEALRATIARDRAEGVRPICVVGSAGTVLTGAIDPLDRLADVCSEEDLWFHVDAAYGGPAMLAQDLRPAFHGIERADSIAFDPHKWLYTPHPGGCILVRDVDHLAGSFDVAHVSYVHQDKEYTQHGLDLGRLGPSFSRSFWALKVWVSLLAHGRAAYARRISHDAALARYLGALVEERLDFELCAPVGLSVACFRYVPPDLDDEVDREAYLNELNRRLMTELQLDGRVFPSNAEFPDGRFTLRICIVNFRTEAADVEAMLDLAAEMGRSLHRELRSQAGMG